LARQEAIKAEEPGQIELLKRTGALPCDLCFDWLPDAVGDPVHEDIDSDSSLDDDDVDPGDVHCSSDEEDRRRDNTMQGPPPPRRQTTQERGAIGTFAFFLATEAPFLVGKVDEERSGEVRVLWYTPKETLIQQAASVDFDVYAKAVFRQTYTVDDNVGPSGRQHRRKRNLIPDTSWEPVVRIAASCPKLRGGKYIPASVVKAIRTSARDS